MHEPYTYLNGLSIYLSIYLYIYLILSILSIKVDTVEMHEPYTYLNGLSITDLEDLLEDILVSISLINWPILCFPLNKFFQK